MAAALGDVPLILKIGLFRNADQAAEFAAAVRGHAAALSTTNSISATVSMAAGEAGFGGSTRGIGGECIRARCLAEVAMLASVARREAPALRLIGVGGIFSAQDVCRRLAAGAHHVQIATAAMLDPMVAIRIRKQLATGLDGDGIQRTA